MNQSKPIETEFPKNLFKRVKTKLVRPHSHLCSETKRNTAQNESLGESPLATVSLRYLDAFVKRDQNKTKVICANSKLEKNWGLGEVA